MLITTFSATAEEARRDRERRSYFIIIEDVS